MAQPNRNFKPHLIDVFPDKFCPRTCAWEIHACALSIENASVGVQTEVRVSTVILLAISWK